MRCLHFVLEQLQVTLVGAIVFPIQVPQLIKGLAGRPPAGQIPSIRCLLQALAGATRADIQAMVAPGNELAAALSSPGDVAILLLYLEKFMLFNAAHAPIAYCTIPVGTGR